MEQTIGFVSEGETAFLPSHADDWQDANISASH